MYELTIAICNNNLNEIKSLQNQYPNLERYKLAIKTHIHYIEKTGNLELFKFLYEELNIRFNTSIIFRLSTHGHFHTIRYLCDNYPAYSKENIDRYAICRYGYLNTLKYVINNNIMAEILLYIPIILKYNNLKLFKWIVNNVPDNLFDTLILATIKENKKYIDILLRRKGTLYLIFMYALIHKVDLIVQYLEDSYKIKPYDLYQATKQYKSSCVLIYVIKKAKYIGYCI